MRQISVNVVISKLLSDLGGIPAQQHSRLPEWIREVLHTVGTPGILERVYIETESKDFLVELPCDLYEIEVVTSCGIRMPLGNTQGSVPALESRRKDPEVFDQIQHMTAAGSSYKPEEFKTESKIPAYYTVSHNHLFTSFKDGPVEITYWRYPVDEEGYPLMPDNEELKDAILHYVLAKLMLNGTIEPKHMNYQAAMQEYRIGVDRARRSLNRVTPEKAERMRRTINRHIFKTNGYDSFFRGSHAPERIKYK